MAPGREPLGGDPARGLSGQADGFTEADYRNYIAAFTRGDFSEFGRYYAADVEFQGRNGLFRGRDAVTGFYRQVRARLRERIEIRQVVLGPGQIVADLVTELEAFADWPELPSGPIAKGETRRSQNFIWYELSGREFSRIRSAHYASGARVDAPRQAVAMAPTGGGPGAEQFARYIDAFNRDDYDAFVDYYAPDVTLVIAGKHVLAGRQAIVDFYRAVKAQTRRTIRINRVITAPHAIAAELESEFLALQDLPEFTAGPMKKGERIFINTVVLYDLREGRFARIRSAVLRKIHLEGECRTQR